MVSGGSAEQTEVVVQDGRIAAVRPVGAVRDEELEGPALRMR